MGKLEVKLGKKIRELRKQKGYTQAELAELVDLSTNFIGYLERGKQVPSLKTLEKIAQALDVTIGYLFYSIENTLHKPIKPSKKEKVLNKIIKHLKNLDIKDINLILRLTKRYLRNPKPTYFLALSPHLVPSETIEFQPNPKPKARQNRE